MKHGPQATRASYFPSYHAWSRSATVPVIWVSPWNTHNRLFTSVWVTSSPIDPVACFEDPAKFAGGSWDSTKLQNKWLPPRNFICNLFSFSLVSHHRAILEIPFEIQKTPFISEHQSVLPCQRWLLLQKGTSGWAIHFGSFRSSMQGNLFIRGHCHWGYC